MKDSDALAFAAFAALGGYLMAKHPEVAVIHILVDRESGGVLSVERQAGQGTPSAANVRKRHWWSR